jgi:hypothetical protein
MKWNEIYTREEVSTNRMKSLELSWPNTEDSENQPSTSGRGRMASTGFTNLDCKESFWTLSSKQAA